MDFYVIIVDTFYKKSQITPLKEVSKILQLEMYNLDGSYKNIKSGFNMHVDKSKMGND